MNGDDLAEANRLKLIEIDGVVGRLSNGFDYVEGVVSSWLWFSKEGHSPTLDEQRLSAANLSNAISEIATVMGLELTAKSQFDECVESIDPKDWRILISRVLPSIRKEALTEMQKSLRSMAALPKPLWADLLPEAFAMLVLPSFLMGDYLSAVRRGCDALRAMMREKTGLQNLDGVDLVNQADGKDGLYTVAAIEGHSQDNVRRGYADMLRGAMTAIRNVHYHGTEQIDEREAARLLVTLGMLWARAETTTSL